MKRKYWLALPATLIPLLAAGAAMAQNYDGPPYYGHMMWGGGGWFMMPLMLLLFFVVIVVAVVLALRLSGFGREGGGKAASARAILEERFARGEIDKTEFEDRKRALDGR